MEDGIVRPVEIWPGWKAYHEAVKQARAEGRTPPTREEFMRTHKPPLTAIQTAD